MMIINPGSGPVGGATIENATLAIEAFITDLGLDDITMTQDSTTGDRGRFAFTLRRGEYETKIDMPGIPLDRVRYTGAEDQNIWHFPRLYVDGSSWVWCYAINSARCALTGED